MKKTGKLLICEDDEGDQQILETVFKDCQLQYATQYVKDGNEALDILKTNSISLLLMDLNIPCNRDFDVLKAVKEDISMRRIPIIVLAKSNLNKDIKLSYALGANSYIVKPDSYEEFKDLINTLIKYWLEISRLPI